MNPKQSSTKFNLQAAIDALPPEGGVVVIPPGIHRLNKPRRTRRRNVRLKGTTVEGPDYRGLARGTADDREQG